MVTTDVIQEKVRFGADGALAGVLAYGATTRPTYAALICSPHPNFGGDLENNVVAALAARSSGVAITLRFNYRGVGDSRIHLADGLSVFDYWENIEETLDYTHPLADTQAALNFLAGIAERLPIVAIGYSFGAIMATRVGSMDARISTQVGISPPFKRVAFEYLRRCVKPTLMISGEHDFVGNVLVARALADQGGPLLIVESPVAHHFFIGQERELADRVARFIQDAQIASSGLAGVSAE